ncbi:type II secretion system F family protein, partial [Pelomonas sp. KK5]|uniref:type II secretion system F family protein n=1 Tax=Pelomonas sp. KK5 TaxID=1855730 RepID=UPI00097BE3D7
ITRKGRFPLLAFCQELVSLLEAGLSLPETIEAMVEKESRPQPRRVMGRLRDRLFEGQSLSRAMEDQPAVFTPLLVATVRAAERSSDLPEALGRYIDYQQRIEQVRRKIVSASIYPLVLLGVGTLVTVFLLAYVVPRFASIYAEAGRDLPWLSQLLLQWGKLMNGHGAAVLLSLAAGVAAMAFAAHRAAGLFLGALARLPGVGEQLLVYHLARFYRTLGMLMRGGTPVVPALGMVGGLLPADLRGRLALATQQVSEGASLSDAMGQARLTTPIALRMLRVGEESGDMATMMERIAAFHDERLSLWVDWFTKLFEPLLMALMGVVIGGIVVLMYLPIFDLAGSLQ